MQLTIWENSVQLLASIIEHQATQLLEPTGGTCVVRLYESPLDLDDYIEVCAGRPVQRSWAFTVRIEIPGIPRFEKLAYVGYRSPRMHQAMNREGGPSLFWSGKNPGGFPKWLPDGQNSPYAVEVSTKTGNGDGWSAIRLNGSIEQISTTELATRVAAALIAQATA